MFQFTYENGVDSTLNWVSVTTRLRGNRLSWLSRLILNEIFTYLPLEYRWQQLSVSNRKMINRNWLFSQLIYNIRDYRWSYYKLYTWFQAKALYCIKCVLRRPPGCTTVDETKTAHWMESKSANVRDSKKEILILYTNSAGPTNYLLFFFSFLL